MSKRNNLFTLSYFRKRLKDAGISSKVLIDNYDENDKRYWTVSIDKTKRIMCTCFRYEEEGNQTIRFMFSDGKQNLPIDKSYQTESMIIILEMLKRVINT